MIPAFVATMGATTVVPMDYAKTGTCLSLTMEPDTIVGAVTLLDKEGYLLEDVMASDLTEGFEVAYHFSLLDGPSRIVLRLIVPHDAPQVPSIASIFPGADWHERECFDFYGIDFTGHPNLHYLLLPEDFEGHPLIKSPKARKSLADLMQPEYLPDGGQAEKTAAPTTDAQG